MDKRWYRLYYTSVGGGVVCEGPEEFSSKNKAVNEAYRLAVEDYETFEGYHGIPDFYDIRDDKEGYGLEEDASEDDCWEVYREQRENWLDYWVEEASGPDDKDEGYQ